MKTKKYTELMDMLDTTIQHVKDLGVKAFHAFADDGTPEKVRHDVFKTLRKIRLALQLTNIKDVKFPENEKPLRKPLGYLPGQLVQVRPVGDEYGGKTYVGLLVGDIALSISITVEDDAIVPSFAMYNPAILIPSLNKIVYGIESWWGEIESEAELRQISDDDIANVWYVKALKQMG